MQFVSLLFSILTLWPIDDSLYYLLPIYSLEAKDANRVDRDSIKPVDPKDRSILELDLKLQHRSLSRDFQRLSSITIPEGHRGDFVEPRIINLWREAQFSNFTEEELESLKVSWVNGTGDCW